MLKGPAPLTARHEIENAEADLLQNYNAHRDAFAPVTLKAGPTDIKERRGNMRHVCWLQTSAQGRDRVINNLEVLNAGVIALDCHGKRHCCMTWLQK